MISHKHVIHNNKCFVTLNLFIHNSVVPMKLRPATFMPSLSSLSCGTCTSDLRKFSCESYSRKWSS